MNKDDNNHVVTRKEELILEIEKLSKNKKVKGVARKLTDRILVESETFGNNIDAECAKQVAFETLLIDAQNGKLILSDKTKSKQAVLMDRYKMHVRHHLLKRYHRRSVAKDHKEYQKELLNNEKEKELSLDELESFYVNKISKYSGSRFDKVSYETEFSDIGVCIDSDVENPDAERLLAILIAKGASDETMQLINYRLLGYNFTEISEKLDVNKSTITKRFQKNIKALGIDPKLIK